MEGEGKVQDFSGSYTDIVTGGTLTVKTAQNGKPAPAIDKNQTPVVSSAPANGSSTGTKRSNRSRIKNTKKRLKEIVSHWNIHKSNVVVLLNTGGSHEQLMAWAREIEQIDQTVAKKIRTLARTGGIYAKSEITKQ